MKRPRHQKKYDTLLHGKTTAEEVRCDMCLAPFDKACTKMDLRWGVNVLPELVSVESASKWGKALAGLNGAMDAHDHDKVKFWVEVCLRGLTAMDAEATAAGHQPADPMIWEYELDGVIYGIIEDGRQWPAAYRKRKGIVICTMREVAIALAAHQNALVRQVKDSFNGAEVTAIRKPVNDSIDDDLGDIFE